MNPLRAEALSDKLVDALNAEVDAMREEMGNVDPAVLVVALCLVTLSFDEKVDAVRAGTNIDKPLNYRIWMAATRAVLDDLSKLAEHPGRWVQPPQEGRA